MLKLQFPIHLCFLIHLLSGYRQMDKERMGLTRLTFSYWGDCDTSESNFVLFLFSCLQFLLSHALTSMLIMVLLTVRQILNLLVSLNYYQQKIQQHPDFQSSSVFLYNFLAIYCP